MEGFETNYVGRSDGAAGWIGHVDIESGAADGGFAWVAGFSDIDGSIAEFSSVLLRSRKH